MGDFHYLQGPEGIAKIIEEYEAGTITIAEVIAIIGEVLQPTNQTKDCTLEYKAALHALGLERVANAIQLVRIRLGEGVVSVGYQVDADKGIDLNELSDEEHLAMGDALIATLRAHDLDARRDEEGDRIVFTTTPDIQTNFTETIKSFTDEIDEVLGPSTPEPGESRWNRWM